MDRVNLQTAHQHPVKEMGVCLCVCVCVCVCKHVCMCKGWCSALRVQELVELKQCKGAGVRVGLLMLVLGKYTTTRVQWSSSGIA